MRRWIQSKLQVAGTFTTLLALWATTGIGIFSRQPVWTSLNLLADAAVTVWFVSLLRQDLARATRRRVMDFQAEFLRRLAKGHDLSSILQPILDATAIRYPHSVVIITLPGAHPGNNKQILCHEDTPSEFQNWFRQTPAAHTTDELCMARREAIYISDTPSDPLWSTYSKELTRYGFSACWIFPVFDWNGGVLGTFGLYHTHQNLPSPYDAQVLKSFASAVGLAFDKSNIDLQYHRFAYQDPLTGLGNRRVFVEHLEQAIENAAVAHTTFALLWLDLDRFKDINDSLGHNTGDQVLVQIAARLPCAIPDNAILARLGGDEFAILVPHADQDVAVELGRQMLVTISQPMEIDNHVLVVTGSLGISTYPSHGSNSSDLMRHADLAMYEVKGSGRAQVRIYNRPEFTERALDQVE